MYDTSLMFFNPPADAATIWRYMDLTKLLSLLEARKLVFCRADKFQDPYEGMPSEATAKALRAAFEQVNWADDMIDTLRQQVWEKHQRSVFISCWCENEHESAAMWKLYLQSNEGIAIRTSHGALRKALNASSLVCRTSKVYYVDYNTAVTGTENLLTPFVCKRVSFEHEREVRAIIWAEESQNPKLMDATLSYFGLDINPGELIQAVHVAPSAPKWFGELVEQLLKRYGLNCPIQRSTLYERPVY